MSNRFTRHPTQHGIHPIEEIADDLLFDRGWTLEATAETAAGQLGMQYDGALHLCAEYRAQVLDAERGIPARRKSWDRQQLVVDVADMPF